MPTLTDTVAEVAKRRNHKATTFASPADAALKLSRGQWQVAPHLRLISDRLAAVGETPLRLIVTLPPRHGKSEMISHWTPVWFLSRWPDKRVILCSYEADFAASWGRKVRNSIQEAGYDALGIRVSSDSSAASAWAIAGHSGGMTTAGVGGPISGKGADLLIIDDPVKNQEEAASAVYRQRTWDWWLSTARTRLEPGASVVVLMTRWHEDDLVGRMLKDNSDNWEIINLPALAEHGDALGRAEGQPLWPERYPADVLGKTRMALGPYFWASLYQQHPVVGEGQVFHRDWWQYYDETPYLLETIQAWDTAFQKSATSDRSACVTLGRHETGVCVLGCWAGRVEYPDLVRQVQAQYNRWQPERVLVEEAASGQSLIQSMRRESPLPILAVKPEGDKISRAHRVTGIIEAGRVSLPRQAPWLNDFLEETANFPTGAHDDIVDALVYGLQHMMPALCSDNVGVVEIGRESKWR